ncbi:type I-E CRISPR-associated protein Cse1/CasA [Paracoccus sp. J55]|uniref:type I-E CRISPR-associated protein Cse1/CasA n=1 Tax=Paracoccus sp. J55 TaxID=935849 RepID=UPI0004BC7F93|nr:type I-E CRISPR-associated protein Cse1/CasA [Paracoccus sp. J55]
MSLNLVNDPWIPVRRSDDGPRIIRPDQIADPGVVFPDWPRADLNIACLELLIGLVFLADPPANAADWRARKPDAQRLRERLAPFAPAFDLMGDGPRFLQDFDPLEGAPNPPDMLFIDSAGGNTARNNADLMVRRNRYPELDLPLAAMALYTLQAHAPSGGAGNRTSMRGGGPMVTLVDPGTGSLWDLVWANIPDGQPAGPEVLPWMRPTRTSEAKGAEVWPDSTHPVEAFFGMPRRLRLVGDAAVTGVIQRPYGANYAGWEHPLTPCYRQKAGSELLPLHPRAGAFGYRNWLGVVMEMPGDEGDLRRRARCLDSYERRVLPRDRVTASVIVAGYAMDNMKPRDFTWSRQPLLSLESEAGLTLIAMIQSAESFGLALRGALKVVAGEGSALDALREEFFTATQGAFEAGLAALLAGTPRVETAARWLRAMERVALAIFDRQALPGLDQQRPEAIRQIIDAREGLRAAFAGWRNPGKDAYVKLGLGPRPRRKEAA